ncbi:acyltransferase [Streptomyces sp. NPDC048434]|uniref:acyltransferase n=1 Tax=Streptomyces sp. NPDC048434 TaxID=3365549 RepID=UPI0037111FC3
MMSTEEILRLTVAAIMSRTGETHTDVAASIGQARSQVSRKQRGQAHWSFSDADSLAAHWGVPVLDLLAGPLHAAEKLPADRLAGPGSRAQTLIPLADPPTSKKPPKKRATPKPAPAAPTPPDRTESGELVQAELEPCVLCGVLVTARAGGVPQHAFGVCGTPQESTENAGADGEPMPASALRPAPVGKGAPSEYAPSDLVRLIKESVQDALASAGGDIGAAQESLIYKAIPSVMDLFERSRTDGRYTHSSFPPMDEIFTKKSQKEANQIWEGRPKWRNRELFQNANPDQDPVEVSVLDTNAAYLSALKCWLPIGELKPVDTDQHLPDHAGAYLISPPEWLHADLPNPLGNRMEPGDVWVMDETLRLLLDASTAKSGRSALCEPPVIRRALLSGATEGILEKLRRALAQERKDAIAEDDDLTYEYVKSMYSVFVSTIGNSVKNDAMRRQDWVHTIRAKSYANHWRKTEKAHRCGLTIVSVTATDELHVIGDWRSATLNGRRAFPEGRNLNESKEKDTYILGGKR